MAIITLGTSPKSICIYVEETILENLPKKLLAFLTFPYGIQMPRSLVRWNLLSLAKKKI